MSCYSIEVPTRPRGGDTNGRHSTGVVPTTRCDNSDADPTMPHVGGTSARRSSAVVPTRVHDKSGVDPKPRLYKIASVPSKPRADDRMICQQTLGRRL